MGEQTAKAPGLNRAKTYQLVLFPLNNGATNVYYVLVLSYIATFGSKVLALSMIFASVMVTGMRLFDAITDPIIGALMDRTNGKFGKFRPFMVIGNLIMAASILVLYCLTPLIPASSMGLRYAAFVALYAVWVIGYTFQTSCTRSGQTVLTNDPKQRPLFTIFNTVGSLLGMGAMQFFAPILAKNYEGGYASAGFFRTLAPVGIVISILLTILAIIGIWEKDQPKYFGIGGEVSEKVKLHEYVQIIKNNNPMQRLMVAGAGCKLALSIATNTTVLCMLYGCMMGNYDGLYLPMMVLGYVFSVPFFLLTVRTSQKEGQKASLMKYVSVAFICYIGVLVLLLLWGRSDAFTLSIMGGNGLSINLYTILFIAFFGIGYGAYYATADMPIPMVADCSDYETYRSGNYIPGIMGTLFSLVDKLVSSLSATVVGIAVNFICAFTIKERVKTETAPEKNKLDIPATFRNKYFWMCVLIIGLYNAFNTCFSTFLPYYATYILSNTMNTTAINYMQFFTMAIMSFITFGLCKKFDTTVIVRTGMIIAIVGQIVGIVAPTSLGVQMVSAVIRSIGWGLLAALIHSMVGDAIEYGHWRTGHKAPGTTYAAQGVGNKLGVLIGSGVTTLILGASGYDGAAAAQVASALSTIKGVYLYLPLAFAVVIFFIMCFYKLNSKNYNHIVSELEQGRYHPNAKYAPHSEA